MIYNPKYQAIRNGSNPNILKLFEHLSSRLFIIEKTQGDKNADFIREIQRNITLRKTPFITDKMVEYAKSINIQLNRTLSTFGIRK